MEARQKLQPSHLQCQGAASVCLIMLCLVFQSWHQQQPKWGPPFHIISWFLMILIYCYYYYQFLGNKLMVVILASNLGRLQVTLSWEIHFNITNKQTSRYSCTLFKGCENKYFNGVGISLLEVPKVWNKYIFAFLSKQIFFSFFLGWRKQIFIFILYFLSSTFTCPLIKPDPPSHNPHMWAFYACLPHPFPYPYHRHEMLNNVEGLFVKCHHIKVDHVFGLAL